MKPAILSKNPEDVEYVILPKESTESVQLHSGVRFTDPKQPEPYYKHDAAKLTVLIDEFFEKEIAPSVTRAEF